MLKKIAITGPESTGKSKLAKQLAEHYNTKYVPEFAREYINLLERQYNKQDILKIAKGQILNEQKLENQASGFLFCDTELIVTKIWCEHKFGFCHDWILETIKKNKYDLYLLANIDIPWQDDPQREHPNLRNHLFNLYFNELKKRNFNFEVISGQGKIRLENAIKAVDARFKSKT